MHYRPERISSSIQVNQVGYATGTRKFAFFGNWLGSAGAMPLDDPSFRVLNADTGAEVLAGSGEFRKLADPWSSNDVYQADISELHRPGRYRIEVPGLGISDPFRIAPDIFAPLYRGVLRLFYHNRNSAEIIRPWADAGHERPQGGVPDALDGIYHEAVAGSPLGCAEQDCKRRPVSRG